MNVYKFFLNIVREGEIKYQVSGFTFATDEDFARELAFHFGRSEYGHHVDIVINDIQRVEGGVFGVKESAFRL